MRWMKTAILSIACLAFAAGAAKAETNWVGINGGMDFPTGEPFSDAFGTGWNLGATGTWMFAPTWGVGVDLGYYAWGGKDEPPGVDATASAIQATGHFLFMVPSQGNLKPWLKGGLGMYNIGGEIEVAGLGSEDDSEANFGFNVGGGLNLVSSPTMTYGIGLGYHSVAEGDVFESTEFFTVNLHVLFGVGGPQ